MTNPVQGITNREGDGWNISHNVINGLRTTWRGCGSGGVGILVGCHSSGTAGTANTWTRNNGATQQPSRACRIDLTTGTLVDGYFRGDVLCPFVLGSAGEYCR